MSMYSKLTRQALEHEANEWADAACNGVVWLRNIRDGISTPQQALTEMESNLTRIRDEHTAAIKPRITG